MLLRLFEYVYNMGTTGEKKPPFKRLISQSIGFNPMIDAEGDRANVVFSTWPVFNWACD